MTYCVIALELMALLKWLKLNWRNQYAFTIWIEQNDTAEEEKNHAAEGLTISLPKPMLG